MKKLYLIAGILWGISSPIALAKYKYQEGDCITPINDSWSWYQGFATVKGVFERKDEDYYGSNIVYLLLIVKGAPPWTKYQGTQQSVYDLESIDDNTQKAPQWMCDRS